MGGVSMCGLFGFSDPYGSLTPWQARQLVRALAVSSMVRGTDATGIAYNSKHRLHIYKRAEKASDTLLYPSAGSRVVMGHVRMTTQGNAKFNHNNHPFPGDLDGHSPGSGPDFALAHNGVLTNDLILRHQLHLPKTRIETDSYVAVQILQAAGTLDMDTLAELAQQLEGTFTLTVLDREDNLYFVRGNNPLCLVEFSHLGLFVYASTAEILQEAIARCAFLNARLFSRVWTEEGEILKLGCDGRMETRYFDTTRLHESFYGLWGWQRNKPAHCATGTSDLLDTACNLGYDEEDVAILQACGYCSEEIEELLQDPELFRSALQDAQCEFVMYGGDYLP